MTTPDSIFWAHCKNCGLGFTEPFSSRALAEIAICEVCAAEELMTIKQLREHSGDSSYDKAVARGETTFTLRAQDRSSPKTVAFWIMENIVTAPPDKLRSALEDALKMREWPNRKTAD